jgi:hypothetical protein
MTEEPDLPIEKKKPISEPIRMGGILMLGPNDVIGPVRPRPKAGPQPTPMEMVEFKALQDRVYQAIRNELPPDWEFMCCIMGPNGEKEVIGSLHSSQQNRDFIAKLGDAIGLRVWRS